MVKEQRKIKIKELIENNKIFSKKGFLLKKQQVKQKSKENSISKILENKNIFNTNLRNNKIEILEKLKKIYKIK